MRTENGILVLLKEKHLLVTELQKELQLSTEGMVGVMGFLEQYKLVETWASDKHELMAKITLRGLQLLNLPSLPEDETTGEEVTELMLIKEKIADKTIDLYTSDQQVESIKGITAMATRFNTRNSDVIHALWLGAKDTVGAKLERDVKERRG